MTGHERSGAWMRGRDLRVLGIVVWMAIALVACGGGGGDGGSGGGGGGGASPLTCADIFNGVDKGTIAVDASPATGVIAAPGIDCYTFQATAGTLYQFNLSNPGGPAPAADLRFITAASVGDLVTEINVTSGGTDPAEINLLAPYSDTYLLGITGDYSITVEEGAGAPLAEFPRMTNNLALGTWIYGNPLTVGVSHTNIPAGAFSMNLVDSVTATINNTFAVNSFATGTPSTTASTGKIATWGDQRETAGGDWVLSMALAGPTVGVTTRYGRMSNWGTVNVEQQDFDFPSDPGSNRYYYGYAPYGPGAVTMDSIAVGTVSCGPPTLTAAPSISETVNELGSATYDVSAPVSAAAVVTAFMRPVFANFSAGGTYNVGQNTTGGAGTATITAITTVGAGDYVLDLLLEAAADPDCETYYIAEDIVAPASPPVIPANYYVMSVDATTIETRFDTNSGFPNPVQSLTVVP